MIRSGFKFADEYNQEVIKCFSSMTQLHARFEDAAWRIALGLMSSDFAFSI